MQLLTTDTETGVLLRWSLGLDDVICKMAVEVENVQANSGPVIAALNTVGDLPLAAASVNTVITRTTLFRFCKQLFIKSGGGNLANSLHNYEEVIWYNSQSINPKSRLLIKKTQCSC